MLPVSNVPSLVTMRWTTESALVHTAVWFEDAVTGLGLNDVLPRCPTMFTCPAVAGGGVGPGFGPGSLYPPPPQTGCKQRQGTKRVPDGTKEPHRYLLDARSTIDTNGINCPRDVSGVDSAPNSFRRW